MAEAFMSYAHRDNEACQGRILQLASLVEGELTLITGERRTIWTDVSQIALGADWRERIESALEEATVFLPIVTPGFFKSDACREELSIFVRAATRLGLSELIIPVYFASVDEIDSGKAEDSAMMMVSRFQYADWRELRLEDQDRARHLAAVHSLASRIADARAGVWARQVDAEGNTGGDVRTAPSQSERQQGLGLDPDESPSHRRTLLALVNTAPPMLTRLAELARKIDAHRKSLSAVIEELLAEHEAATESGMNEPERGKIHARAARELDSLAIEYQADARAFSNLVIQLDPAIHASMHLVELGEGLENFDAEPLVQILKRIGEDIAFARDSATALAETEFGTKRLRRSMYGVAGAAQELDDAIRVFQDWRRQADRIEDQLASRLEGRNVPAADPYGSVPDGRQQGDGPIQGPAA